MKLFRYGLCVLLSILASNSSAQWAKEANYPGGVNDALVSFAIGDTIYIGGGSTGSTSFYKYDPSTGNWTKKGDIPHRAFGVGFSIGSNGYVATGQSDPANVGQGSVSKDFWEYDPTTDHWTKLANFPGKARDAAFAFVIGSKAYIGGGTDVANNVYSDFYCYDADANKWDTLQALPDYLYFCAAFAIGNYGYLATGSEGNNELVSTWQYDPTSDSWNEMSDFPGAPRQAAVGFTLNGKGYVGLGQAQYDTNYTDFFSYDPAVDSWTPVTSLPVTHGRAWAVALATSTSAFVGLGTYFSGNSLFANNDLWEFPTSTAAVIAPPAEVIGVYPNPATDFVNIDIPYLESPASINVRNEIGELCHRAQLNPDGRLDLSSLPTGIYNIEIASGDYHASQRVVKE